MNVVARYFAENFRRWVHSAMPRLHGRHQIRLGAVTHHGLIEEAVVKFVRYSDLGPQKGITYTRVHLRRLIKAGRFPIPRQLSAGRIGFVEEEIDEWIASRPPVLGVAA